MEGKLTYCIPLKQICLNTQPLKLKTYLVFIVLFVVFATVRYSLLSNIAHQLSMFLLNCFKLFVTH